MACAEELARVSMNSGYDLALPRRPLTAMLVLGGVLATTPIRLSLSRGSSMAVTSSSPLPRLVISA